MWHPRQAARFVRHPQRPNASPFKRQDHRGSCRAQTTVPSSPFAAGASVSSSTRLGSWSVASLAACSNSSRSSLIGSSGGPRSKKSRVGWSIGGARLPSSKMIASRSDVDHSSGALGNILASVCASVAASTIVISCTVAIGSGTECRLGRRQASLNHSCCRSASCVSPSRPPRRPLGSSTRSRSIRSAGAAGIPSGKRNLRARVRLKVR
mmetsp:Transcript_21362/g.57531  ORF Transcript_21362/g.57531 Transcript_21362/m.57531 type:complete len:209 (-) Transcript_21362:183-809(-)